MTRTEESPSRADVTRAKLREAGIDAFSRRGFHGTTTRDLTNTTGLSTAALYVHYASKEALLYAISKEGHEETLAIFESAVRTSDQPREQLRRLMTDYAAYHAREHIKAIIINRELAALELDHLEEITAIRKKVGQTLELILRTGAATGDFDIPDIHVTAVALLSLGLDIARWYRASGEWSPEYLAERYTEIAFRIVGARPPSA